MVFPTQRPNTPSRKVNTVAMLVNRLKSLPNQRPKVENRSALSFVEATNSQNNGSRKYATAAQRAIVRIVLLRSSRAESLRREGFRVLRTVGDATDLVIRVPSGWSRVGRCRTRSWSRSPAER